jgi:peptidoglycan/LPS O-acetylase OafA/YrhL
VPRSIPSVTEPAAGTHASHSDRFDHLDGLRGVAALTVAMCHFVLALQPAFLSGRPADGRLAAATGLAKTPLILFWNPEFGVAVFFVLSGFVLAAAFSGRSFSLPAQIVRRWIRLAGPILGSSLLIWAVVETGFLYNAPVAKANHSSWLAMHFVWRQWEPNDLLILVKQSTYSIFANGTQWWNAALWTMPIEFWGSLGLFGCYWLHRQLAATLNAKAAHLFALAVALVVLGLTWQSPYGGFATGAAFYEISILAPPSGMPRRLRWIAGLLLFVVAFITGGTPYELLGTPYWQAFVWTSAHIQNPVLAAHRLGAALMVAAVLIWPPLQQLLSSRLSAYLGRISFMTYLCHIIVLCSLVSWIVLTLTPRIGYDAATAVSFAVFLPVVFATAHVMTRWVDAPSIMLSRRAGRVLSTAMSEGKTRLRRRLLGQAVQYEAPRTR